MRKDMYCFWQIGLLAGTLVSMGLGIPAYASTAMSIVLTVYYLVYGDKNNDY